VASFCGYPILVGHLLEAGADVNCRGQCGETPLHLAAVGSTPAVVNHLLNAGADVNDVAQVSVSQVSQYIVVRIWFSELFQ